MISQGYLLFLHELLLNFLVCHFADLLSHLKDVIALQVHCLFDNILQKNFMVLPSWPIYEFLIIAVERISEFTTYFLDRMSTLWHFLLKLFVNIGLVFIQPIWNHVLSVDFIPIEFFVLLITLTFRFFLTLEYHLCLLWCINLPHFLLECLLYLSHLVIRSYHNWSCLAILIHQLFNLTPRILAAKCCCSHREA